MSDYKFIAGAVCPACGDMDSIKLKNDDSEIKCISCNYYNNNHTLKIIGWIILPIAAWIVLESLKIVN